MALTAKRRVRIPYPNPTLFGMMFASRLFREIDKPNQAFEEFCQETGAELNLQKPEHARALLNWLNRWGCRITKDSFPLIFPKVAKWFGKWEPNLPNSELVDLDDHHLDKFANAYDELLEIDDFGPTSGSKALFAVRPHGAMPWDAEIQAEFDLRGRAPENYRAMLLRSKTEAEMLIHDATTHCGAANQQSIPRMVGSPDRTLPKLLDEYHWVTITRQHQIPTCGELKQWARWASAGLTS
jgi:hypothetical protein